MWEGYDLLLRAVVRIPVTTVESKSLGLAHSFGVSQSYPNPFNSSTRWTLDLDISENIRAAIYDVKGRKIKDLWNGWMPSGRHVLVWDGRNDSHTSVPSGVYLLSVFNGNKKIVRKLNLVR